MDEYILFGFEKFKQYGLASTAQIVQCLSWMAEKCMTYPTAWGTISLSSGYQAMILSLQRTERENGHSRLSTDQFDTVWCSFKYTDNLAFFFPYTTTTTTTTTFLLPHDSPISDPNLLCFPSLCFPL